MSRLENIPHCPCMAVCLQASQPILSSLIRQAHCSYAGCLIGSKRPVYTVNYKTVDMFPTCVVFDEYLHIEKSSPNEIGCVGKGCFSAFEQDINHAIILFFDGDID